MDLALAADAGRAASRSRACQPRDRQRQALTEALALAQQLSELAPNALASSKELLNNWPTHSLPQQLDCERDSFVDNLLHPNAAEGIAAFRARRAPRFG